MIKKIFIIRLYHIFRWRFFFKRIVGLNVQSYLSIVPDMLQLGFCSGSIAIPYTCRIIYRSGRFNPSPLWKSCRKGFHLTETECLSDTKIWIRQYRLEICYQIYLGTTYPTAFTCSKSTMKTPKHCLKWLASFWCLSRYSVIFIIMDLNK